MTNVKQESEKQDKIQKTFEVDMKDLQPKTEENTLSSIFAK